MGNFPFSLQFGCIHHSRPTLLRRINLCIFLLIFTLLLNSVTNSLAAIKVRRHFNEKYAGNTEMENVGPAEEILSPARKLLLAHKNKGEGKKEPKKIDAHCWIRIERKNGEFYEENGSCARLSRGVYACQSKTFVDPFNAYCMFMD